MIRKLLHYILILSFFLISLCGCQTKPAEEKIIVLREPVNASIGYELASFRDLYDVDVFSTVVSPYVEEYAFSKDQVFGNYETTPGQKVSKGDVLVNALTRDSKESIEEIADKIDDLESSHAVEIFNMKSEMDSSYDSEAKYGGGESYVKQRERLQERIDESNALYLLEKEHLEEKKKLLEKESYTANIISSIDGEVVNCAFVYGSEETKKDIPLIAIGDTNKKQIKCEYINAQTISSAEDFYGVFDGKRYELVNNSIDSREASIQKKNGETVYSTFFINDPDNEISLGQYGVVVLLRKARKGVLCVPKDSVKTENGISYVYTTDGESSVYTEIQTGMSDDFYVEVLSGINNGDKILTNNAPRKGKNTAKLAKGECSTLSKISGFLYFPFSKWIVNPADEGSAYIKEICVEEFQQVNAGDTILTIEAVQDSVEIDRVNRRIARLTERISEENERKKEYEEKNKLITDPKRKYSFRDIEKNLFTYQKELSDENRKLAKLKKYSGVIEIKAETDGIISDIGTLKVGDVIYPDTKILQFADMSKSYIVLKDEDGILSYGQPALVDCASSDGGRITVNGRVVTVSNTSLSTEMKKQWSLVAIDDESKDILSGSGLTSSGLWARNSYDVSVNTRQMKDVVLVPKTAVLTKNRNTYVKVINSDGSVSLKGFISGGSNNDYYWVVSGLSEGTEICWD